MKIQMMVCFAVAAALLAGCATENRCKEGMKCEMHECQNKEACQAKFLHEAKISKETAERTALAKAPGGTVKDGELEKEHDKLQWSFDIATPSSKNITEVNVDALTGDVISVQQESAGGEAKETDHDKD